MTHITEERGAEGVGSTSLGEGQRETSVDANVVGPSAASIRREHVIRKRGYFYRPNAQGYCADIREAGRWTFDEAFDLIKHLDPGEASVHHEAEYPAIPALERALNERNLFINPSVLDLYADEIDCAGSCEYVRENTCIKSDRGEYCPNDLAETLRAVAKVARATQPKGE